MYPTRILPAAVAALCLTLFPTVPVLAAPITWEGAVDVSSSSDVSTNGSLVVAANLAYRTQDTSTAKVNGVSFTGVTSPSPLSIIASSASAFLNGNTSGNSDYDSLLNTAAYGGQTGTSMTLGGGALVSGQNYEIQVWFVEERAGYSGRVMTFGSPGGGTVNLGGTAGNLGQYAIGTFTADGPNQTLTLATNGFPQSHLTAYQIRSAIPLPNPTVTLSTASNPVSAPFTVDVAFNKDISGLESTDFTVVNGVASNVAPVSGPASAYTVLVTPVAPGLVSVQLPGDRVTDADTHPNLASNTLQTTFEAPEVPVPTIHGSNTSPSPSHEVFLTFSEDVTGLEPGDFVVTNGSVTSVAANGRAISPVGNSYPPTQRHHVAVVTAMAPGLVEITLPAGSVVSLDGNGEANVDSNSFSFQCTSDFSEDWIIDEAAEWATATGTNSNLDISGGFAEPTANLAQFSSIVRTFPVKKKATSLTFMQSPVWNHWNAVANINPVGASDAPVLISVANDNYYFLGKGSTNGYHAWHSTNMVNWTERGPVTPPVTGRWVTSAEYKDGDFYIYSDYFNDHTPRLFKDSNLDDGVVGTDMGPAFIKTASGSDCALIRSDEDGLFHLIYEDWSPINAQNNSWDSPLAGHATSSDGLTGFTAHGHAPPVDLRTTPTGTFGTYNHPDVPNVSYEIHTPAQDAFGDWTSIKIGSRFYLFGDFDEHDAGIKVGRFTSDSIYKKFELVGSLGNGHPDPTVGFAEGKFYLLTQQTTDYTSPGPWVDGVEARAGVDTDGNGTIDQWTSWQSVSEQYDHTPGFIRVVTLTPAALDLTTLPEGYGFQFEFRIDDTVVPGVNPIMDRAEFAFAPSNFQQWANTRGTPALIDGDHNHNGIPNLVEFAIGASSLPPAQGPGTYSLTAVSEALADGYTVQVQFSENLQTWQTATGSTEGFTLTDTIQHGNGDEEYIFEIEPVSGDRMYWRILVF